MEYATYRWSAAGAHVTAPASRITRRSLFTVSAYLPSAAAISVPVITFPDASNWRICQRRGWAMACNTASGFNRLASGGGTGEMFGEMAEVSLMPGRLPRRNLPDNPKFQAKRWVFGGLHDCPVR